MRLALCGVGRMGANHLRLLSDLEGADLVAIIDADANRAAAAAAKIGAGCRSFTDIAEALDQTKPDACVIAAPTVHHHALALPVLERKVPLLLEKPIARTAEEGLALCALAERTGTPFMIGHVERFNPAVAAAKRIIAQGTIGACIHLGFQRIGGSPRDLTAAGDVLVDLAVHDIDIAHMLVGAPPRLLHSAGHAGTCVDAASLVLQAGDALVDVHCNWLTPVKIRSVQITGSEGFMHLNLITQKVTLTRKNYALLAMESAPSVPYSEYLGSFSEPDQVIIGTASREPLKEELAAFLRAVQDGAPMPVAPRDALLALDVAEVARRQVEAALPVAAGGAS